MKRWLKTFLVLVAILLLPTLWLLISHVRAKHALERYKAQLRAAGEQLTIDELLPPRIPAEKNGAKLFVQAFPYLSYEGLLNSNSPPAMRTIPPDKAIIGWQQPALVSEWDNKLITNSWKDLEEELKKRTPGLEILHQVAARPGFDFGMDYHDSSFSGSTNLMKMKNAAMLLTAATVSDLNRGETSSAVTNVHALVTLVNQWKDELLISQLVRIAMAAIASTAQWEVLQSTNLTDPDLAMLQHDWESVDLIEPMGNGLKMERVWSLAQVDQLRTSNSPSSTIPPFLSGSGSGSSGGPFDFIKDLGQSAARATSDRLWRVCWSYDDELHEMQGLQITIETVRQIETNGFFDKALAEQDRKLKALGLNSATNNWLRTHLDDDMLDLFDAATGAAGKTISRMLRAESQRRIIITAIALKRYQLRHGTWPADLGVLSPEFLSKIPCDPADGQPLHYQPNPDGTFTLYSMTWIWPQPATAPEEIQQYYTNLLRRISAYKQ